MFFLIKLLENKLEMSNKRHFMKTENSGKPNLTN